MYLPPLGAHKMYYKISVISLCFQPMLYDTITFVTWNVHKKDYQTTSIWAYNETIHVYYYYLPFGRHRKSRPIDSRAEVGGSGRRWAVSVVVLLLLCLVAK